MLCEMLPASSGWYARTGWHRMFEHESVIKIQIMFALILLAAMLFSGCAKLVDARRSRPSQLIMTRLSATLDDGIMSYLTRFVLNRFSLY